MNSSAWELDGRPTQPCVVCRGVPDRTVDLPELPDVHVGFGSSALCSDCAAAAHAGEAEELARRAEDGWVDDPEVVPDLVRLVLAAAGHESPPKPVPDQEFRHSSPEPLADADAAIWKELEPLVFGGPDHDVVVRGRIEREADGQREVTLVHRAGARMRLADVDGRALLITDGVTMWRRDAEETMIAGPRLDGASAGQGSELAHHRRRENVELFDFGTPIGPIESTEYLGRSAWRFRFAAPAHKPYDMRVVVDAETGLVLEKRFGNVSVSRWTAFVTDEPVELGTFQWDGPAMSAAEVRAAEQREYEAEMATRERWFAEHVSARPLVVAGKRVTVMLHDWAPDGSFDASLDGGVAGSLARRPRSSEWWQLDWSDVTHRWSDQDWDWAVSIWDPEMTRLDDATLAEFARALGSAHNGISPQPTRPAHPFNPDPGPRDPP